MGSLNEHSSKVYDTAAHFKIGNLAKIKCDIEAGYYAVIKCDIEAGYYAVIKCDIEAGYYAVIKCDIEDGYYTTVIGLWGKRQSTDVFKERRAANQNFKKYMKEHYTRL